MFLQEHCGKIFLSADPKPNLLRELQLPQAIQRQTGGLSGQNVPCRAALSEDGPPAYGDGTSSSVST
jgi:hypothetical protein